VSAATIQVVETAAAVRRRPDRVFPDGLNRIVQADCLELLRTLPDACLDLVYVDPPFFSGRNYAFVFQDQDEVRSFADVWEGGLPAYLGWLEARLREMHRVLTPAGSLCVHLDWHAAHYVKVALDGIFGYDRFRNEIVWCYSIGGKSRRTFGRKHDTILWYAKGDGHHFSLGSPHARIAKKPGSHMKTEKDRQGRVWQIKTEPSTGKVYRYPLDKMADDWWADIEQLNWEDRERLGYPTQKPEALLRRLIGALCPEPGSVADFFCGGGTTCAAAQQLGRAWLGCDSSRVAISLTAERLVRLLCTDSPAPKRRAKRGARPAAADPLAEIARDGSRLGASEALREAAATSLVPAIGFTVGRCGEPNRKPTDRT